MKSEINLKRWRQQNKKMNKIQVEDKTLSVHIHTEEKNADVING